MSSPDKVTDAADRLGSMAMTRSDAEQAKQCASCGKTGDALKRCTACKLIWYCGVNCQIDHRKSHRKGCKRIKKELEASSSNNDANKDDEMKMLLLPLVGNKRLRQVYSINPHQDHFATYV